MYVPGGLLCPPSFPQAAFFGIAREPHCLFLDRDIERKKRERDREREMERERDGEGK